jgi:Trk-type K+ transport system membrane component
MKMYFYSYNLLKKEMKKQKEDKLQFWNFVKISLLIPFNLFFSLFLFLFLFQYKWWN